MMGIHELFEFPEFQRTEYLQFVFSDADAMCEHQYTPQNSLFPDYIGSYFYHYGDHPYPDGARAEGLTAAYFLTIQTGEKARQQRYFKALVRTAWACLHLCNTRESLYSAPKSRSRLWQYPIQIHSPMGPHRHDRARRQLLPQISAVVCCRSRIE